MGRNRTKELTDGILGQHIALSVAAGMARTQLTPDPLRVYDAQHLIEMIDIIARALAKVAPLYVRESDRDAAPRQLSPEEQESATIKRGATLLTLRDGRIFSSVSMRRGDLRQAIAVLKAVGVPEIAPVPAREPRAGEAVDVHSELLRILGEIDRLLARPLVQNQTELAKRLALSIARKAPQGRISNLAMQLMSSLYDARDASELPENCRLILTRLRGALDEKLET